MTTSEQQVVPAQRMATRPRCARCQHFITIDTDADDDLWAEVIGERFGPGYICADCFTRAADERLIDWVGRVRLVPYSLAASRVLSASLPCKSGEGAGEREAGRREVNTILSGLMQQLQPDCPDMVERIRLGNEACTAILALRTDATQTREAEGGRIREIAATIYAEVADEPLGDLTQRRQSVQDTWYDAVRASLNARGGA